MDPTAKKSIAMSKYSSGWICSINFLVESGICTAPPSSVTAAGSKFGRWEPAAVSLVSMMAAATAALMLMALSRIGSIHPAFCALMPPGWLSAMPTAVPATRMETTTSTQQQGPEDEALLGPGGTAALGTAAAGALPAPAGGPLAKSTLSLSGLSSIHRWRLRTTFRLPISGPKLLRSLTPFTATMRSPLSTGLTGPLSL
mmetsp:Transcript_62399/g.175971  ORF Transcript_62399/g.175971 Transcript_62399/m.175971 type:complete len:200 (-) Transcript_62399:2062-2661(-)